MRLDSPTVRRPSRARMTTPSRSLSTISKLMICYGIVLVYRSGARLRRGGLGRFLAGRQQHGEAAAFAYGARHFDVPAVHLGDPRDEAQSEAEAGARFCWRVVHVVAGGEDVLELFRL